MKLKYFTPLGLLLILLTSCTRITASDDLPPAPDLSLNGKVVYMTIEGGFYAIVGEDNKTYEPMNLPTEFQKDGLAVYVEAKVRLASSFPGAVEVDVG